LDTIEKHVLFESRKQIYLKPFDRIKEQPQNDVAPTQNTATAQNVLSPVDTVITTAVIMMNMWSSRFKADRKLVLVISK
jgi:hypothetical protein